jgi:hypothetical protein
MPGSEPTAQNIGRDSDPVVSNAKADLVALIVELRFDVFAV